MHLAASRAFDVWALEVGRDLELQAAGTGQEDELVDSSHNITDLTHLALKPVLFRGLRAGLA